MKRTKKRKASGFPLFVSGIRITESNSGETDSEDKKIFSEKKKMFSESVFAESGKKSSKKNHHFVVQ